MQPCNRTRFTAEFRETAVRRYLSTDIGYRELGEKMGTSPWTLRDWVRKHQGRLVSPHKKETTRSTDNRTGQEKLRLLLEARALPDEQLGELLRREGIREGDLERWEQEALGGLERGPSVEAKSRQVRELEGRLHKSQKRLKEADALLDLQKKVHALWGGEDDDTPHS